MRLNPNFLPPAALYGNAEEGIGWQLSPQPFALSPALVTSLQRLGPVLHKWVEAMDTLYLESHHPSHATPAWVSDYLNQGKPSDLLTFGAMKRFKSQRPIVLRPDLLLTGTGADSDAWMLTELDSVPGGLGFTSALYVAYQQSGFNLQVGEGLAQAFLNSVKALTPEIPEPVIAVVVSDESKDYWAEWQWLIDHLRQDYPALHLVKPQQLDWHNERLVFSSDAHPQQPIDTVYRFFELFDRPNIPKLELLQYAVKKGRVVCSPPFKPHQEEKLWLALLHHPALTLAWERLLGKDDFEWLRARVPESWILDHSPLPPHASIPGLVLNGQPVQSFQALRGLSQKQRELVIKPSGFSALAWGSRGVTIGHDIPTVEWDERVQQALDAFPHTPHILQRYHKPASRELEHLDLETGEIKPMTGRTRLCPYYLVQNNHPVLSGALATHCPANKKIIHGMRDAILAPCSLDFSSAKVSF